MSLTIPHESPRTSGVGKGDGYTLPEFICATCHESTHKGKHIICARRNGQLLVEPRQAQPVQCARCGRYVDPDEVTSPEGGAPYCPTCVELAS